MKKSYSKQDKEKIITQYESGVSITSIYNSTGIARSTLHNWINEYNSRKRRDYPTFCVNLKSCSKMMI